MSYGQKSNLLCGAYYILQTNSKTMAGKFLNCKKLFQVKFDVSILRACKFKDIQDYS
jgi:hypothetical protein